MMTMMPCYNGDEWKDDDAVMAGPAMDFHGHVWQ
jgi:hypothetical protein